MSKPKVSYNPVIKPKTSFTGVAKPDTSYTTIPKNRSTFTNVPKPSVSYDDNTSPDAWRLDSTVVTLNSIIYRLNGYLTAIAPNQLNNKNPVTYAEV